MEREIVEKFAFDGIVFHELRGTFYKIPENGGTRNRRVGDIGKDAMESMPELMQKGSHLVEGEQSRFGGGRTGKIHH